MGPGATARQHYELVHLELASEEGAISINLIPIAVVTAENRLLVAAPEAAWSRQVKNRLLPHRGLQKPILVEVAAASMEEPEEATETETIKLWVGLLDPKLEERLKAGGSMQPTADVWHMESDPAVIPHGPSLAEVAEDHFAFLSAQSAEEVEDTELMEDAEEERVGDRLKRLEQLMEKLLDGEAVSQRSLMRANPKPASRPPAIRKPAPPVKKKSPDFSGLDPTVVASAIDAGIPSDQLEVLGGLLKKTSRMQELPRPLPSRKKTVLSESEDEEDEGGEAAEGEEEEQEADQPPAPVEKAVMQLTKIVSSLAKKKGKQGGLEELLENADTGESIIYLSEIIEVKGCCVQKVAQCPAEETRSFGEHVGGGYGGRLLADEGRARCGGEDDLRSGLDRAQVEVAVLPQHNKASMGARRHLRLPGQWSDSRGEGKSFVGNCCFRPVVAGRRPLADGTRNADGSSTPFCCFSRSKATGELGAECDEVGGGESRRSLDVEAEGQGCFQRGSEAARFGKVFACGSAGEGEPVVSRSKTEEGCRKGSKGRKVSAAEGSFGGRGQRVEDLPEDRGQPPPAQKEADVPGARASVVHASRIWSSAFGIVCRSRTKLALALFAAKTSPSRLRAPAGKVWPCPLPFPELHRRKANRRQVDAGRKLALNYLVLVMDVFHNGQSHFARAVPGLGTPLNKEQWEMIRRWSPLVDEWNQSCPITPDVMGRSAAKVENVEKVIGALQEEAVPIAQELRSYLGKKSGGVQAEVGSRDGAGEVVGKLRMKIDHVAKALQPERLKFWKVPSFDASSFLDAANRATFLRPFDYSAEADAEVARPPTVKVQ